MNGNGTFNHQILVDKLAKLNNSQQSIETLSHWCIFHRKKAKQVVETWDQQFHRSPQDQRLSFLYLANDILQNSRRKGAEFVAEFWKVLPDALNDVTVNGDDFGRKAALRLVDIWEDRKVFGSRGHILKDEMLGRSSENRNLTGRIGLYKLSQRQPAGDLLESIISSYQQINEAHIDEDALFGRCRSAISSVEKMEKEIGNDFSLGNINGSGVMQELQGQNNILRECMEQLKIAESSRITLQSCLREALHDQELKIDQVRNQLQMVLSRYEQTSSICQQFQGMNPSQAPPEQKPNEAISDASLGFPPKASLDNQKESAPVRYTQQQQAVPPPLPPPPPEDSSPRIEEDQRKNAAAEVAAKLTASTSSAQMLSYVLSSLASEGIIGGQSVKEDYSSDSKRPKVENGVPPYIPVPPQSQPPPPPYPHPDSVSTPPPPPPPPLVTPLMPPATGPQFLQVPGSMMSMQYSYGSSPVQLPPHPLPVYPMVGMPPYLGAPNPFLQGFQTQEGVASFSQPRIPATPPPLSRQ